MQALLESQGREREKEFRTAVSTCSQRWEREVCSASASSLLCREEAVEENRRKEPR